MKNTKYFDKEIYEMENKIKPIIVILIVFIIGLFSGFGVGYVEIHNKDNYINMINAELDKSNSSINELAEENSRLQTIINNYTIQSRRLDN